jgi:hypothetical protein
MVIMRILWRGGAALDGPFYLACVHSETLDSFDLRLTTTRQLRRLYLLDMDAHSAGLDDPELA